MPAINVISQDRVIWRDISGIDKKFSAGQVWKEMRSSNTVTVKWWKLVWFTQSHPSHSFVLWLAIQERLLTQDKMLIWNPQADVKCPLCNSCPDSHSHLFFKCDYSLKIWSAMKMKLSSGSLPNDWKDIIEALVNLPNNDAIRSILRRIVVAAGIYYVWNERNKRLFENEKRTEEIVIGIILEYVKLKLMSLRVRDSVQVRKVAREWDIVLKGME